MGRHANFGWPFLMKEADWNDYDLRGPAQSGKYKSGYIRAVVDQQNIEELSRSDKKTADNGIEPKMEWLPDATILSSGNWHWSSAVWNAGVSIVMLLLIAILTEASIRRKTGREKLS